MLRRPTAWNALIVALGLAASGSAGAQTAPQTAPQAAPQTEANVFVAPFQAVNREATALAALLPAFLAQELDRHPDLAVTPLERVGPVADMPPDVYLQSCPPGEVVGCAFVVAEVAKADFALAGTVESLQAGTRVQVHIIDVTTAREVVSFRADLGMGDDEVFAEGVARVLVAVVRGEVGEEADIREHEDPTLDQTRTLRNDEVNRQLEQLSREMGDVTTLTRRSTAEIERPRMTEDDLTQAMDKEGTKPWERLNMGPSEYMRYKNSGVNLLEWRGRMEGRKGQLLLRPLLGVSRGPSHGSYHGRYVRSAADLSIIETWAWQGVETGTGVQVGGNAGWGLLPTVEVGLTGGIVTGRYAVQIQAETEGQTRTAPEPVDSSALTVYGGPRVLYAPLQWLPARPLIGGEATFWLGQGVDSFVALQENLPAFATPKNILVTGLVGVEAGLGSNIDVWLLVPLSAVVWSVGTDTYSQGSEVLESKTQPPALGATAAGVQAGITVRLLGKKGGARGFDDYGDPDEL